jgi:hypothetical protein
MQMNDIFVNDTPLTAMIHTQNYEEISATAHLILCGSANLQIPLALKGTTSYFVTRIPSQSELDNERDCPWIVMTHNSHEWDPGDKMLD